MFVSAALKIWPSGKTHDDSSFIAYLLGFETTAVDDSNGTQICLVTEQRAGLIDVSVD
jgi:hypothetical protein